MWCHWRWLNRYPVVHTPTTGSIDLLECMYVLTLCPTALNTTSGTGHSGLSPLLQNNAQDALPCAFAYGCWCGRCEGFASLGILWLVFIGLFRITYLKLRPLAHTRWSIAPPLACCIQTASAPAVLLTRPQSPDWSWIEKAGFELWGVLPWTFNTLLDFEVP